MVGQEVAEVKEVQEETEIPHQFQARRFKGTVVAIIRLLRQQAEQVAVVVLVKLGPTVRLHRT
jgi:hypothetical protein